MSRTRLFRRPRFALGFPLALVVLATGASFGQTAHAADNAASVATSFNSAGLDLFDKLTAGNADNFVLSPYSIGVAMSMAEVGARGKTAAEMQKTLHLMADTANLPAATKALASQLRQSAAQGEATLGIANALHLTKFGNIVAANYKNLLRDGFDAEIFEGSDLAAINGWVAQKTDGKIDKILEKLDPNSVCVILNAIALKAEWATKFNKKHTAPGTFHLVGGGTTSVAMMRHDGGYQVAHTPSFDAVALPYKKGTMTMIIVLPAKGARIEAPTTPTGETFRTLMRDIKGAPRERLRLRMPRFKVETSAGLVKPFKALGMKLAFDRDRADFSGITESTKPEDRIHITQIKHKALIEVDEDGTEAAAATAVEFGLRSIPMMPQPFDIDRPFAFYLVDNATGTILFMGRVMNPGGDKTAQKQPPAGITMRGGVLPLMPGTSSSAEKQATPPAPRLDRSVRRQRHRTAKRTRPARRMSRQCVYRRYAGTCRVTSIRKDRKATRHRHSRKTYAVKFRFKSLHRPKSRLARRLETRLHRLKLAGNRNPDRRWLRKYGVRTGRRHSCTMKVVRRGACRPPVAFEFAPAKRPHKAKRRRR